MRHDLTHNIGAIGLLGHPAEAPVTSPAAVSAT